MAFHLLDERQKEDNLDSPDGQEQQGEWCQGNTQKQAEVIAQKLEDPFQDLAEGE